MNLWTPQLRVAIVCAAIAAAFTAVSIRLVEVQLRGHETALREVQRRQMTRRPLHANRGTIFDRNAEPLALDVTVNTVCADQSLITRPRETAEIIATQIGLDPETLAQTLTSSDPTQPDKYIVLKRKVSQDLTDAMTEELARKKLPGIFLEHDSARIYPNGALLSHAIGVVNADNRGVAGIEKWADDYLRGQDGYRVTEKQPGSGSELVSLRQREDPARDGLDLRLTVDTHIQMILEKELDSVTAQFTPDKAIAIVMDPRTGDILAMGSRPSFNCNDWNKETDTRRLSAKMRCHVVSDQFEPGSIFKIVVGAAALEEKCVNLNSGIYCENGTFMFNSYALHDHHPYGTISFAQVIEYSSNIGCAKLGIQLGSKRLYSYMRKFGFGEKTGVQLPAEVEGTVHPVHDWNSISISRVPMGHEVAVTPVQMAAAMCVIANGGLLMRPRLVQSITTPAGGGPTTFPPVERRRVISPHTARLFNEALKLVVTPQGTGSKAAVPGYIVAGKTGTAQKVNARGTGYMDHAYVSSFIGYLPADNPAFVCLVMLDNPHCGDTTPYGGSVAAPTFSNISRQTAQYLNIPPTETIKDQAALEPTAKD